MSGSLWLWVTLAAAAGDPGAAPAPQAPLLHLEGTTSAQPAPAKPKPAGDAPVSAALRAPGTRGAPVWLTVESNRPDALVLRDDTDEVVCAPPCNRAIPAGPKDTYRIGGPGITNSNAFDLADGIRAAKLTVHAGSKGKKIAGIALTGAGALFFLEGALSMVTWGVQQIPSVQQRLQASGQQSFIPPTASLVIGIVGLAVGAAALTTGLVLWPQNTTRTTLLPIEPPPEALAPAAAPPTPAAPETGAAPELPPPPPPSGLNPPPTP